MKLTRYCQKCGSDKYYAKGMCKGCYRKQLTPKKWSKKFDFCKKCKSNKRHHIAHGLCHKCYRSKTGEILCACGCGKPVFIYGNKPKKFRKGHWLRTQGQDSLFQKRHKESMTGKNNPCYGKFGKDHPAYGHYTSPEVREERRQRRLKLMSKKLNKSTNIEIILSGLLDELLISHNPQYLINSRFTVDEFLPEYNLIIEAYGGYWHGDPRQFKEKDLSNMQRSNISRDKVRMTYFKRGGYKVLILWEKELIENLSWCKKQILSMLEN